MALQGSNDNEKLNDLCSKPYKEQACWFLNAFWDKYSGEAERCWEYVNLCAALDLQKNKDGSGLDEVNAHRLLEKLSETMTVMSMRDSLRKTGAISASDRPKLVPLTHYLLFKYEVDWKKLVNTKGDNSAEMKEAQVKLDAVTAAFATSDEKAKIARKAEAEAREKEAPFKAAQEEQQAAMDEVKKQEDAYNNKTETLKRQSEEGGVVAQNKAKNLLAQHLAEDPLPLRKAKVTLEAAVKKAEKARAPFEAATKESEAARAKAEEALEESRLRVQEAEDYLQEVKKKPGNPHGSIWFMERALEEQKKFLPERKGGKGGKK
jgi:chromosome segregation ATPase